MAKHLRKHFARMCSIASKDLSVYIKRGKVIIEDGYIDDSHYLNAEFFRRRAGIFPDKPKPIIVDNPKPITQVVEEVSKPVQVSTLIKEKPIEIKPVFQEPEIDVNKQKQYDLIDEKLTLENEKKALEVEKLKKENRILKAKAEKLEGELIPTELVKSIIRELSEAMKIAYMEATETYTVIVGAQKKLTNEEISKIKSHFTGLINDTILKQVDIAKKMLKSVVEEYSQTKGRGERE